MSKTACPGCGLTLPESRGEHHPYIGASRACWEVYGELLAREYGELDYPDVHRTSIDAYAAQHPGLPERRSIQSVGVHLMGLCLVFERGLGPEEVTRVLGRRDPAAIELRWLDPPDPNGSITVSDVLSAPIAEHDAAILEWAGDVWRAWTAHHPTVAGWLDASLGSR